MLSAKSLETLISSVNFVVLHSCPNKRFATRLERGFGVATLSLVQNLQSLEQGSASMWLNCQIVGMGQGQHVATSKSADIEGCSRMRQYQLYLVEQVL